MVVVEITRPSTTVKYLRALPPVIAKASTITAVAAIPEHMFTAMGVPNFSENRPTQRCGTNRGTRQPRAARWHGPRAFGRDGPTSAERSGKQGGGEAPPP